MRQFLVCSFKTFVLNSTGSKIYIPGYFLLKTLSNECVKYTEETICSCNQRYWNIGTGPDHWYVPEEVTVLTIQNANADSRASLKSFSNSHTFICWIYISRATFNSNDWFCDDFCALTFSGLHVGGLSRSCGCYRWPFLASGCRCCCWFWHTTGTKRLLLGRSWWSRHTAQVYGDLTSTRPSIFEMTASTAADMT